MSVQHTSELDFFAKADQLSDLHRQAGIDGRRLGTLQDQGIFLGPAAPAHLKSALHPMETPLEWEQRMDRQGTDPLIQKFGPGATILSLYYDPIRKAHAMPGDPDSPLMAKATPDELKRLWDDYFRMYPVREKRPRYTAKFQAALDAEEARRKAG